ncbi:MAG TPA: hypothetical protein VN821_08935 [Candidatus Udaeobacter sp.]|nr:hypothetical protein [Candidatus Udaeobacter sp.]
MKRACLAAAIAAAALFGGLAPAGAEMSGSGGNPRDNNSGAIGVDDKRVDQISLKTDINALVTKLVVMTPDCVFRGGTDGTTRRNVNRLGFTQDLPLIGGLFEQTPRQDDLTADNQRGLSFLKDGTIFVDLRPSAGTGAPDPGLLTALADGPTVGGSQAFAVAEGAPALQSVGVLNRNFEYLVRPGNFAALAPMGRHCGANALADLPPIGSLFDKPLGVVYLTEGRLIVVAKPSIIGGY